MCYKHSQETDNWHITKIAGTATNPTAVCVMCAHQTAFAQLFCIFLVLYNISVATEDILKLINFKICLSDYRL